MIQYSLNIWEDFICEQNTKKVICIISRDFHLLKEYFDNEPYLNNIYSLVSVEEITEGYCVIKERQLQIRNLEFLNIIDLSEFILLIYSQFIDYVKIKLNACNLSKDISCYTINLHKRYYNNIHDVKYQRWIKPNIYWYKNSLINQKMEDSFFNSMLSERISKLENMEVKTIPRLIITLTTRCNLDCKECLALTFRYNKHKDFDCDQIIKNLTMILNVVDEISCLELLGGEPFLYKEIYKVLYYAINSSKIGMIQITTNGLVTLNARVINLLQSPRVVVRISDYGLNNKVNATLHCLKENGVKVMVEKNLVWIPVGRVLNQEKSTTQLKDEYALCYEGLNCKNLFGDKLFPCTFSSRCYDLNLGPDIEYLQISNSLSWVELYNFWTNTYTKACNYCNFMNPNAPHIKSGVQF